MSQAGPPVHLPGEGVLLPDGTFVPDAVLREVLDTVGRLIEALEALPPQVRVLLEAMLVVADAESRDAGDPCRSRDDGL